MNKHKAYKTFFTRRTLDNKLAFSKYHTGLSDKIAQERVYKVLLDEDDKIVQYGRTWYELAKKIGLA